MSSLTTKKLMETTIQTLKYWRNSLADSEIMQIKSGQWKYQVPIENLVNGNIDPQKAKKIVGNNSKKRNKTGENDIVSVVFSPYFLAPKKEHGKNTQERPSQFYPLNIPAFMDMKGNLTPNPKRDPWISRDCLEPCSTSKAIPILGTIAESDSFLSLHTTPAQSWEVYWGFVDQYFEKVTGKDIMSYSLSGYERSNDAHCFKDQSIKGSSEGIINLYDDLINSSSKVPPLICKYAALEKSKQKDLLKANDLLSASKGHLGQMGFEFPLSESQRQALYHFLKIENGEILAINGPPGTGKTTLLQNVVASIFVKHAIDEIHAPVIVASSTNNQAVSNIIESFGNAKTDPDTGLGGRWLPDIQGYGLFLLAQSANEPEDGCFVRKAKEGPKWVFKGLPDRIETPDYYEKAKPYFLGKCNEFASIQFSTIKKARGYLHGELVCAAKLLQRSVDVWIELESERKALAAFGGENTKREIEEAYNKENQLQKEMEKVLKEFRDYIGSESLVKKFSARFLPSLDRKRRIFWESILSAFPKIDADFKTESPDHILETITQKLQLQKEKTDEAFVHFKNSKKIYSNIKRLESECDDLKKELGLNQEIPDALGVLDTTIRHKVFQLATHYWEARWIEDLSRLLKSKETTGKKGMEPRYRRYAMLTPCFVSTFYMAPKYFQYIEAKTYDAKPMLDYIDLLIVDEAGQVTPEVGGATFSLAKKALVVGDIFQIEPVVSISPLIDRGNLEYHQLIDKTEESHEKVIDLGITAFEGSVMKVAQKASPYSVRPDTEGGMFLSEHRRCLDGIIEYCNELAYEDDLEPFRGNLDKEEEILPPIGYVHIDGTSQKKGGSRQNEFEADTIAQWIFDTKEELEEKYRDKKYEGKYNKIEDIVGIVTPFASQRNCIIKTLKEVRERLSEGRDNKNQSIDIDTKKMKIGTVHALQGAERPVVIFSPVYGKNDNGPFFFDLGVNMLNVAVSRAKDSFLVFGNMSIFNEQQQTPSGLLARFMFRDSDNQIPFNIPERTVKQAKNSSDRPWRIDRLASLERHQDALKYIFENAEERIVIVSPFISGNAIREDEIEKKIREAVTEKGVEVIIYTDKNFDLDSRYTDGRLKKWSEEGRKLLKSSGADLKVCNRIHNKTLCMDGSMLMEGSFNWLSASRNQALKRKESTMLYWGGQASDLIKEIYKEMELSVVKDDEK